MDAFDLIILTESDAAAVAGAARSIAQLYNLVGTFIDRRDAFERLYAELGALRDILEALRHVPGRLVEPHHRGRATNAQRVPPAA